MNFEVPKELTGGLEPQHVIQCNEIIKVCNDPNESLRKTFRKVVAIIVAALVIMSVIWHENILKELSWSAEICLLIAICVAFAPLSYVEKKFPVEIQFYDDFMIVWLKQHYFDNKLTRMMFEKYDYASLSKIQYKSIAKRLLVFGSVDYIWYDYKDKHTLQDNPKAHRSLDEGMISFYPAEEILEELGKYSPIPVTFESQM